MGKGQNYSQKKKSVDEVNLRQRIVLDYFSNNVKAQKIALSKPYNFYAENDKNTIIKIIEAEVWQSSN